jgi:hypothetical protein
MAKFIFQANDQSQANPSWKWIGGNFEINIFFSRYFDFSVSGQWQGWHNEMTELTLTSTITDVRWQKSITLIVLHSNRTRFKYEGTKILHKECKANQPLAMSMVQFPKNVTISTP